MSESTPAEQLTPPERDSTVPTTAEQRKRRRRMIWLAVRLVLVVLLIVLILWGLVSCFNAVTGAASAAPNSLTDPPSVFAL